MTVIEFNVNGWPVTQEVSLMDERIKELESVVEQLMITQLEQGDNDEH